MLLRLGCGARQIKPSSDNLAQKKSETDVLSRLYLHVFDKNGALGSGKGNPEALPHKIAHRHSTNHCLRQL